MNKDTCFELKKDPIFFWLTVVIPIVSVIVPPFFVIKELPQGNELFILIVVYLFVVALLYFVSIKSYYDSVYRVTPLHLICKFGLFSKSIDINQITHLITDTYPVAGHHRYALSFHGIKIIYGAGRIAFISPEDKIALISKLKSINPSIYADIK